MAGAAAVSSVPGFAWQAPQFNINSNRLSGTLEALSAFGRNPEGGVSRLGFSEADLQAREYVLGLLKAADCEVSVDHDGTVHESSTGADRHGASKKNRRRL